jgi:hypothetical protein
MRSLFICILFSDDVATVETKNRVSVLKCLSFPGGPEFDY